MSGQELVTLGEGNTPLVVIDGIYFKCEFKNPSGSHKDRGFAIQIAKLKKARIRTAVISSSGNAAISAATYCKFAGIKLTVFVSPQINKNKLAVLEKLDCEIIKTKKSVSDAVRYAKENNAYNLRQSQDPIAPVGYESIATEIVKRITPDAVFIPVSSGTSLVGIAAGFKKQNCQVQIHAVQTDVVHPIVGLFDLDFKKTNGKSLADAIVAKYTPREDEVVKIIKQTGGSGWVIGNAEMKLGRLWLLEHKLDCSYEGAAALAALWKAEKKGYKSRNPVCILTGKYYDNE